MRRSPHRYGYRQGWALAFTEITVDKLVQKVQPKWTTKPEGVGDQFQTWPRQVSPLHSECNQLHSGWDILVLPTAGDAADWKSPRSGGFWYRRRSQRAEGLFGGEESRCAVAMLAGEKPVPEGRTAGKQDEPEEASDKSSGGHL